MPEMERIGFVGAGLMGSGMAHHLLKAGHPLTVYVHRNRHSIDPLIAAGAKESGNLEEVAKQSDVIVMCVSNADTVCAVIEGLSPGLRPGQLIIDATTSNPKVTRQIAESLQKRDIRYVDSPVTGSPNDSAAGKVGSLVGCEEKDFDSVKKIVSCYSKVVNRIGGISTGHQAKLLNNFLTQGTCALLVEAYRRARDNGVDWRVLYSVMEAGAARSGSLEKMVKPALEGNYDGSRFTLRNALKDLNYFCEMAEGSDRGPSMLGNGVRKILQQEVDAGWGDHYVSARLDPELDTKH